MLITAERLATLKERSEYIEAVSVFAFEQAVEKVKARNVEEDGDVLDSETVRRLAMEVAKETLVTTNLAAEYERLQLEIAFLTSIISE